jgi:putative transposase
MPRIARATAIGYPHHVTQRGNYQQPVFEDKDDFIQYKTWLKEYSQKYSLKIWAYCLMNNHVHFVCVPLKDDSLPRTFNTLHMRYSQYFNNKKGAKGHLWQGRFFSCILDERHLYAAMRYVENNPVRAKIVKSPEEYKWSSARGYVSKDDEPILNGDCYLKKEIKDWLVFLKEKDSNQLIEDIRKNSLTGRPCGNDTFIQSIEGILGRKLKAMTRGRPQKGK